MEGKAARIARHAVLAVFLCLGLARLGAIALLWSGQGLGREPSPANLLFALGVAVTLAWLWAIWAGLRHGRPVGLWLAALLLACFTALDAGLAACWAGASCRLPSAPEAMAHLLIWALAALGGGLALRQRRQASAR